MQSTRSMPVLALKDLEDYGSQNKDSKFRFSLFGYVIDADKFKHLGDVPGQSSKLAPYYGKSIDEVFTEGGKHAFMSDRNKRIHLVPHIIGVLSEEAQAELNKRKQKR